MDNAQKAIMIGVGLFITIIIISAVLLIVNLGTGLIDDATGELGSMSTTLQNQILQTYDGKIVSGTQVKAAINQYYSDPDVSLAVYDKAGAVVVQVGAKQMSLADASGNAITVGAAGLTTKNAIEANTATVKDATTGLTEFTTTSPRTARGDISNTTKTAYINTAKNFNAAVVRNASNDTVVGILFQPVAD